jgi:hypothetical protein
MGGKCGFGDGRERVWEKRDWEDGSGGEGEPDRGKLVGEVDKDLHAGVSVQLRKLDMGG